MPLYNPTGGGSPTGSAGGDLTGTYPNPTVASGKIVDANVNAAAAIAKSKLAALAIADADVAAGAAIAYSKLATNPYSVFAPQWPSLVAPVHPEVINGSSAPGANSLRGCRVVVPKTGNLRDLYVWIGTSSGNVRGCVFDTGDTTGGSKTRLWDGASTASAANWLSLGDPNLPVTAGQQIDLAVMADNGTVQFGRLGGLGSAQTQLPTSFWSATGGNLPKLFWRWVAGSFATPSSDVEANFLADTGSFGVVLIARIS